MNALRRALLTLTAAALAACGADHGDPAARNAELFRSRQGMQVCAAGATVKGIDVSEWQGSINWGAVAGGGYAFAFIRVSDGSGHLDPYFGSNWSGARNAGLLRGAYQFFEPSQSASAQAQVVIDAVGRLGPGDLPVMMDVETATPTASELNTWLSAVEAGTGKRPVIYTSSGLWNQWFPGGGFGSYGLVVANWGVSCPNLPAGWSNWDFWQYSDNTAVPGISGNVDADEFNGSLSALQAYADADQAPRGYLDAADCSSIRGWGQDQDVPNQAINVDLYYGGAAGSGAPGRRLSADVTRQDLCSAIGSCDHGFDSETPRSLMDGAGHEIHAYGIDANGNANAELSDSPRTLTCAPTESGVRRHVTDPTSYAAWGFSSFQDVRPVSAGEFASYTAAQDWPASPQLIRGDGTPEVYLVDGAFRRHVVSPDSAASWHLDLGTVQVVPVSDVQAMPQGPDLRQRPQLIQGAGPEIDVLDDPLPELDAGAPTSSSTTASSTSAGSGGATDGSTGGSTGTDGSATTGGSTSSGASAGGSTGGTSGQALEGTGSGSTGAGGSTGMGATGSGAASMTQGGCASGGGSGVLALGLVLLAGVRRRRLSA